MRKHWQWIRTKWRLPEVRYLAILGGSLVLLSMLGGQLTYVPGTHPSGPFMALFYILTLPGQMVAGALDPIFGFWHRQSFLFFGFFIAVSMLVNAFAFGAIGSWWHRKRNRKQNTH